MSEENPHSEKDSFKNEVITSENVLRGLWVAYMNLMLTEDRLVSNQEALKHKVSLAYLRVDLLLNRVYSLIDRTINTAIYLELWEEYRYALKTVLSVVPLETPEDSRNYFLKLSNNLFNSPVLLRVYKEDEKRAVRNFLAVFHAINLFLK